MHTWCKQRLALQLFKRLTNRVTTHLKKKFSQFTHQRKRSKAVKSCKIKPVSQSIFVLSFFVCWCGQLKNFSNNYKYSHLFSKAVQSILLFLYKVSKQKEKEGKCRIFIFKKLWNLEKCITSFQTSVLNAAMIIRNFLF